MSVLSLIQKAKKYKIHIVWYTLLLFAFIFFSIFSLLLINQIRKEGDNVIGSGKQVLVTLKNNELKASENIFARIKEKAEAKKRAEVEASTIPKIAIIVTGLGLSQSTTEQALKLPAYISFSFSPYAANLKGWAVKASEGGREILLDIPMEPHDYPYSDPGPYGLISSQTSEQNNKRLKELIDLLEADIGFVSSYEEKFSQFPFAMGEVLKVLKEKDLIMVLGSISVNKPIIDEAESLGVSFKAVDRWLDKDLSPEKMDEVLRSLTELAKEHKKIILLTRPYPISITRLQDWISTLPQGQVELVPISKILPVKPKDMIKQDEKDTDRQKPIH